MGRKTRGGLIGLTLMVGAGLMVIGQPAMASPAGAHGMDVNRVHEGGPNDAKPSRHGGGGGSNNLSYHGGTIAAAPAVYLVMWGSQWNNNDPSGEAAYLQNFYAGLQASATNPDTWSTSTTQYCEGVAAGTTNCAASTSTSKVYVGHPASSPLAGVWYDNAVAAPSSPTQSNLAGEAARAAAHFGNPSPNNVQYVVATAHGDNPSGFGVQYCAWHSSTSTSAGTIAYTNLPYITDAGGSCGQNFVNSGASGSLDGVSIVGGHEYAETVTDMFPNSGWLDGSGAENGDKCAWISPTSAGGAADITLSTGTFAVQTLWSNSWNNNLGGCVLSYVADPTTGTVTQVQ